MGSKSTMKRPLALLLFAASCGLLALVRSGAQTPAPTSQVYVPNEILVTLAEPSILRPEQVNLLAVSVGIETVDSLFATVQGVMLRKLLPSYDHYSSAAGQRLERTFLLRYGESTDPVALAEAWSALPYFERVEPNYFLDWVVHGARRLVPGPGTAFSLQWYLDNADDGDSSDVDVPEAWVIEQGDPSLVIAIFDEGAMVDTSTSDYGWRLHSDFNYCWLSEEDVGSPGVINGADLDGVDNSEPPEGDHPYAYKANIIGFNLTKGYDADQGADAEYRKRFWYGIPHGWKPNTENPLNCGCEPKDPNCPCPNSWEVVDYNQHGVWVASIAAAKLDSLKQYDPDIVGVAHNCRVYWARFQSEQTSEYMAEAIIHLSEKAQVLNMSFGGPNSSLNVRDAVNTATGDNDCVVVASTGNYNEVVNFPAQYDSVLGVGAVRRAPMILTTYSNWTSDADHVDIVAPVDVGIEADSYSDCPGDEYPCGVSECTANTGTGTSFAAPQVSGVAALVRSRFPGLNQFDVKQRIKRGAQFYWDFESQTDRRKYGSGKVNAYRTLTEHGSLTGAVTWKINTAPPIKQGATWVSQPGSRDGVYYVSGDLTIEPGVTLTISPGCTVMVAPDHEKTGSDTERVQIVVKGTLNVSGTPENPVVFQSFTDSLSTSSDWIGIKFESTATGNLSNVVIRNATRAIENHAAITLTNCTITDCAVALDAYAGVTANGCLIANNTDAYTAVDIQTGSPTFTNCTIVENAGSALAARGSSAPTLEKCVVTFNGGPAVRAVSGWTGTATVQHSVLYDNDAASGSLTDAQWVTTGTNVHNLDPAFCDAANRDYHLYAFSPAAPGASSSERWGTFDVACAPDATVSGGPSSFPFASGDSRVIASCPHGDAPAAVVSVDLDDGIMTRDVAGGEFQLRLSDFSSKVFNNDSSMVAGGGATSGNGWTATISHGYFGGSGVDMVDVLLNGWPLAEQARLDIRTPDFVAPFGLVNTGDFAYIGSNYQSPPKPYVAGCDLNGDGAVSTLDLSYFSQHVNHQSPYSQVNAPAGLMEATVEMVLGFTSEYITATHQRLYVDVDLDNIGATTACVLMLRTGDATLELVEWQPAGGEIGDVLFTPTVRDGVPELFIGVLVDGSFAGSNERLGRLVFDVFQSDPIEITEDHFVLSYGEVLVDNPGGTAMAATMTGSVGRQLDTEIARVYHDRLEQNFPNPFNPTTTLAFSIKAGAHVKLTIYDVAGRRVRDLVNEQRAPGAYRVVWDGRNENGAPVSTGVYFYKLVAGSFTATRKMTLLK